MDKSNGYEQIAAKFAKLRGESPDGIGSCYDLTKLVVWGFDEFRSWITKNCGKR